MKTVHQRYWRALVGKWDLILLMLSIFVVFHQDLYLFFHALSIILYYDLGNALLGRSGLTRNSQEYLEIIPTDVKELKKYLITRYIVLGCLGILMSGAGVLINNLGLSFASASQLDVRVAFVVMVSGYLVAGLNCIYRMTVKNKALGWDFMLLVTGAYMLLVVMTVPGLIVKDTIQLTGFLIFNAMVVIGLMICIIFKASLNLNSISFLQKHTLVEVSRIHYTQAPLLIMLLYTAGPVLLANILI